MVNKWKILIGFLIIIGMAIFSDALFFVEKEDSKPNRINGFNLVAPPQSFPIDSLQKVKSIGVNWVSVVPYAFCNAETAEVVFDHPRQWWGEKPEGIIESINMAKSLGLKVMVKPHLWVGGQGWAGDLEFKSDSLWQIFEKQYADYIETYAHIADSLHVELYCIGTEMRRSTQHRSDFWRDLISKTRMDFSGKLTYAANWDEYNRIKFWSELDYIGIDAYFPLSQEKNQAKQDLVIAWQKPKKEMEMISSQFDKKIIFTEYGYESVDYNAMGHWRLSKDTLDVNFENQKIAFEALFQSFNSESWWTGGFIWKWHLNRNGLNKRTIKAYTPQNKTALKAIESEFKQDL